MSARGLRTQLNKIKQGLAMAETVSDGREIYLLQRMLRCELTAEEEEELVQLGPVGSDADIPDTIALDLQKPLLPAEPATKEHHDDPDDHDPHFYHA